MDRRGEPLANRTAVAFDEDDLAELERIVLDRDAEAALEYLRRVVWPRVRQVRRGQVDPRQPMGPHP